MTNSFVIENQKRRSGKNTLNIHYGRACVCAPGTILHFPGG